MLDIVFCSGCNHIFQVLKWFAYDCKVNPVSFEEFLVAKGPLCSCCGKRAEAWPMLTTAEIKQKLDDPKEIAFQVVWQKADGIMKGTEDRYFHEHSVRDKFTIGIKAAWPFDFVDAVTFEKSAKKDFFSPALKLCKVTIKNPEGVLVTGGLFQLGTVPESVPKVRVSLYTDEQVALDHFLVDKDTCLHTEHGKQVQTFKVNDLVEKGGEGRSLKHALVAPTWTSTLQLVDLIDKDIKAKEEERQRKLQAADAASEAAQRGDARAANAIARAAALSQVLSASGLKSSGSADAIVAPAPPARARRSVGEKAVPGVASAAGSAASVRGGLSVAASSKVTSAASDASHSRALLRRGTSKGSFCQDLLTVGAGSGSSGVGESPVKEMDIKDLAAYIMGPKNYSPGREIRGVLTSEASL
jgi:hypothetical protein